MKIESIIEDRRVERSAFLSQALHFQLKTVARRFALNSVVLSDPAGHLWSASSFDGEASDLAMMLTGVGSLADDDGLCQLAQGEGRVLLKTLKVGETSLYLAAQGQGGSRFALEQAAAGVERIIASN